jgi:hypothetical protein
MVGPDRPQMIVRRMRIACWVTNATDTHSEYVIFIAFQRQQWLCERASVLRYIYISCLVHSPTCVSLLLSLHQGGTKSTYRNIGLFRLRQYTVCNLQQKVRQCASVPATKHVFCSFIVYVFVLRSYRSCIFFSRILVLI